MALAPLITAWQQTHRGLPGPTVASRGGGSHADGVSLLPDVLSGAVLAVLVAWGADPSDLTGASWVWTDITPDVMQSEDGAHAIDITQGKPNEFGEAPPADLRLTLKNPSGTYSAYNSLSVNWPNVVPNVPIWVRVFYNGQWYSRFVGKVLGWPQEFDETGNYSIVKVNAKGIKQQLDVGNNPLNSALYRYYSTQNPAAYWSLEDGSTSTRAANTVSGGNAMSIGSSREFTVTLTGKLPLFAQTEGPPGSDNVADFSNGGILVGSLPTSVAAFIRRWQVEASIRLPVMSTGDFVSIMQFDATTSLTWDITADATVDSGSIFIQYFTTPTSAAVTYTPSPAVPVDDDEWHHFKLTGQDSAGTTVLNLYIDGLLVLTQAAPVAYKPLRRIVLNPGQSTVLGTPAIGHVAVWQDHSTPLPDGYDAFTGHDGEIGRNRMSRLADEEGVPFLQVGNHTTNKTMGPQRIARFLDLMTAAAFVEGGYLYDGGVASGTTPVFAPGLIYIGLTQRYNQSFSMTIDASAGDLVPPFDPLDDDFGRTNRVRAERDNGSFATYEQVTGPLGTATIGVWDTTLSQQLNAHDDTDLLDRAAWEAWKGTIAGFRYAQITIDFTRRPSLVAGWLASRPTVTATITPPFSPIHPSEAISVAFEGWTEHLSKFMWQTTINCSRGLTYGAWQIANTVQGRLQASASTVVGNVSIGDSSMQVATASGYPLCTTAAADFVNPMYVLADGVIVTVTNVTGASSPQTFTIVGSSVTRMIPSGASVTLYKPGKVAL